MKIVITLTDPSAVWRAVHAVPLESGREGVCDLIDKFVARRERVSIEFDLATGSARVIPLNNQEKTMTYEQLIKLQETNNKALISTREMIGDMPGFQPDPGVTDLLEMLLYTEQRLLQDISAITHGKSVR